MTRSRRRAKCDTTHVVYSLTIFGSEMLLLQSMITLLLDRVCVALPWRIDC